MNVLMSQESHHTNAREFVGSSYFGDLALLVGNTLAEADEHLHCNLVSLVVEPLRE